MSAPRLSSRRSSLIPSPAILAERKSSPLCYRHPVTIALTLFGSLSLLVAFELRGSLK